MKMREVRCCCDARLLGYLPKRGKCGETIAVGELTLEIDSVLMTDDIDGGKIKHVYAYKSKDYPRKELRKLKGWKDVPDDYVGL